MLRSTLMDDATICPLCQKINGCGIAAGRSDCWCFTTPIAETALAALPEGERMRRCICADCASNAGPADTLETPGTPRT